MVTTIIETSTQTVTATEVKTSSKLITPSPTLGVVTVTESARNGFSKIAQEAETSLPKNHSTTPFLPKVRSYGRR